MNFKKSAEKLEYFLEELFEKELPIVVLDNGSLIYDKFKIKKNKKTHQWDIYRVGGFKLDTVNLKSSALMAAKCYSKNWMSRLIEIKLMDREYQHNSNDSSIFKYRYKHTQDLDKKDVYLWRWEITTSKAKAIQERIAREFKSMF